jgi:hypothetical protein
MTLRHLTDDELDGVTGGARFSSFISIDDSFNFQQNIVVQNAINVQAGILNVPALSSQSIVQTAGQVIKIN